MSYLRQYESFITPALLVLAVMFYVISWVINPSGGLTLGGYDLASWANLHPASQTDMTIALLLRLQLVVITWCFAATIQRPINTLAWWIKVIIVGLLVIAQLPAPNFIDANARQQLLLSGISGLGVLLGMIGVLHRFRAHLWILAAFIGIGTTFYAVNEAIGLMRSFGLPAYRAGGSTLLMLVYVVLAFWGVWQIAETNRAAS